MIKTRGRSLSLLQPSASDETGPLEGNVVSERTPDALMIPEAKKTGARMSDRVASVADIAEPLLAVDRSKGERAYIRIQPGGRLFVSKDVHDTILFPKGHPRDGHPRYRWVSQENGLEYGYLVERTT